MLVKFAEIIFGPLQRLGFSHKIQETALWSSLESFSAPFFSLLLIPIFTHSIGLDNYGLYVMVIALVNFFSFTGLGMQVSITYYLALNHKTSSPNEVAERLVSALLITLMSTVFFSCIFLLLINILKTTIEEQHLQLIGNQQLINIALGLIVITQLDMIVSSAIKGLQQFKASSKVEFSLRLMSFMIIALVAVKLKSVEAIALVSLLMAIINLIVRFTLLNKIINFDIHKIKISKQITNELFHFGKWMTLQNLSGAIFGSLDKILLGLLFNTNVVGMYSIMISVTQLGHYVFASASSFIMPKISSCSTKKLCRFFIPRLWLYLQWLHLRHYLF